MIWNLHFLDRKQARVVRQDGLPISDYMDWTAAQKLVEAHNTDIRRLVRGRKADA
jgi:predicted regulator of Ras-like GTPase activity (Roadblock/LC7/MglB family)